MDQAAPAHPPWGLSTKSPLLQTVALLGCHPASAASGACCPLGPFPPPVGSSIGTTFQAVGCGAVVLGEKPPNSEQKVQPQHRRTYTPSPTRHCWQLKGADEELLAGSLRNLSSSFTDDPERTPPETTCGLNLPCFSPPRPHYTCKFPSHIPPIHVFYSRPLMEGETPDTPHILASLARGSRMAKVPARGQV